MRVRKNVWRLPTGDSTLDWYSKAVARMQSLPNTDPMSWGYQAAIHGVPGMSSDPAGFLATCQHGSAFFVPWHRMYLLHFERIVASHIAALGGPADWALPYWDYSSGNPPDARKLPVAFRSSHRADGSANPLYVGERSDAANSGQDPFQDEDVALANALLAGGGTTEEGFFGVPPPSHFAGGTHVGGQLEGTVHNNVHGALGYQPTVGQQGWMGNPDLAARDPIFWLHHANIDRLWAVWLARDASHANPKSAYWLAGVGFSFHDATGATVRMTSSVVLDLTAPALDYTYEDVSDPLGAPVAPGPAPGAFGVAPVAIARGAMAVEHELVGASLTPIELSDAVHDVDVPTPVTPRAFAAGARAASLQASVAQPTIQQLVGHVLLQIENMKSAAHSPTYDVYLNVPNGADPKAHPDRFVQRMTLFGAPQASDAANPHGGSGQTFAFDITRLYYRLHAAGEIDPTHLRVSFVPVRAMAGAKVQVGRISMYFA
jgi:tyrosinase